MRKLTQLLQQTCSFAGAVLMLLVQCSQVIGPQSDGGDISVVDNKICGTVRTPQGEPAAGATVYLRSAEYLADETVLAKRTVASVTCTTVTDGAGKFAFSPKNVGSAGVYTVEAVSADSQTMFFIDSVVVDSALFASTAWLKIDTPQYATTLAPPCTITGSVRKASGTVDGTVKIYGLDAVAPLDENGDYTFDKLPAGQLRLEVRYASGDTVHTGNISVTAEPGKSTAVAPIANVSYVSSTDGNTAEDVWKNAGDTLVVDTPKQEKAGCVFSGWNSEADGSGTTFQPGDTLIVDTVAVSLHAQWKEVWYSLDVQSTEHGSVTAPDSAGHGVPVLLHH